MEYTEGSINGATPKMMVFVMENPMKKWMIYGTPICMTLALTMIISRVLFFPHIFEGWSRSLTKGLHRELRIPQSRSSPLVNVYSLL